MIDEKTKAMVLEALNDEYKARAFYRLMIKTFGPVRPFINIVEAEDTHARARERLCARWGFPCRPMHGYLAMRHNAARRNCLADWESWAAQEKAKIEAVNRMMGPDWSL